MDEKELTRAKNAAYRFLSYRPRSRAEIEDKLRDKEFSEEIIQAVIVDLIRLGYVNDEQFAGQWARSRVRLSGFGRRRIELELKNKGVDREIVTQALGEAVTPDAERETAKRVASRKLETMKLLDQDTRRRRLAGVLERKGFSYDVIWEALKATDKD